MTQAERDAAYRLRCLAQDPEGWRARKRLAQQRHYAKHPDKVVERQAAKLAKQATWRSALEALKVQSGCVDCGWAEDGVALDFDHVTGTKVMNVSTMIACRSWGAIMEEVAKCEVRCANCHRIRTRDRLVEHGEGGTSPALVLLPTKEYANA
jgi:hypothetical protein